MPATTLALCPPSSGPIPGSVPERSDEQLVAAEMALAAAGFTFGVVSVSDAGGCRWCGDGAQPLAA